MLENRSFDHMLGYLPHPDPSFAGLKGTESNPAVHPPGKPTTVSPSAGKSIRVDPGHSHVDVVDQLTGSRDVPAGMITNSGFIKNYERKIGDDLPPGSGALIMGCQSQGNIPVLSTLALEFAVYDHWFCSVPGATWPNRNFALSGTSDGQVNIKLRFYQNATVFQRLEQPGVQNPWMIYHDGIPQVWAFSELLDQTRRKRFRSLSSLEIDIRNDNLPQFAYVEPAHFGRDSCSQHPSNNTPRWYRNNPGRDFDAAERLIAEIYTALVETPAVFEKTLFLITYDEHGGFYDHVAPPRAAQWELDAGDHHVRGGYTFRFDMLGPRVPAVAVSPYVARNTVVHDVLEHSSICGTVRRHFAPGTAPLSKREAAARRFDVFNPLPNPRTTAEMPQFDPRTLAPLVPNDLHEIPATELDDFQQSILQLGDAVSDSLQKEQPGVRRFGAFTWWPSEALASRRFETVAEADSYQRHVVELVRES